MSRTTRGLVALVPFLAATTLTAVPLSSASPAAPVTAPTDAPDARGATGWTRISTGSVELGAEPTLLRTGDGVLHAVYHQRAGQPSQLEHAAISPAGEVGARTVIATWNSLAQDPELLATPSGGMELVFSGLQDTNTANYFSWGSAYHALSDASGSAWSIPEEQLPKNAGTHLGGLAAARMADGTTAVGHPYLGDLVWRATPPIAKSQWDTQASWDAVPPDSSTSQGPCCVYDPSFTRSGDALWAAWYGNGGTPTSTGTLVQQLSPAPGPIISPPGAAPASGATTGNGDAPLVTRPDGSVVAAYCTGSYGSCEDIWLWQVGATSAVKVPGVGDAWAYDVSVTASGRLWVAWSSRDDKVFVARTGPTGFRFGGVSALGAPSADVWTLAVNGTDKVADVVVNDGASMFHRQVKPSLLFKASALRWDGDRAKKVKVVLTDAGVGVAGAKVVAGGEKCRTSSSGACVLTFSPRKPGKVSAKVSAPGYLAPRLVFTVKP